jgi:hypothetical protein
MDASSVFECCAVFATKHALALAHASGGGKCKRRVPYPECNGGRRRRSAQAQRGRLGCLLSRARGRASQQLVSLLARSADIDALACGEEYEGKQRLLPLAVHVVQDRQVCSGTLPVSSPERPIVGFKALLQSALKPGW